MDRQLKREEFAKCLKKLSSFRTPYYEEVFKRACLLYRELYVLPLYAKIGKTPAAMVLCESGIDENTIGNYYCHDNVVNINVGRVMNATGQDKVERALEAVIGIGHEYRHNLQKEIALSMYQKEKLDQYKNVIGDDAEVVGLAYIETRAGVLLYGTKKESSTLLEFFPALVLDVKRECGYENFDDLVKVCSRALYYQSAIEVDARKIEREVAQQCADDMKEFFLHDKFPLALFQRKIDDDRIIEEKNMPEYKPIVKKIYHFFDQLKPARFERFAKELYRMQIKGAIAYQAGLGDDADMKEVDKMKDLLKRAISLYADKNIDYKDLNNKKRILNSLRNVFVKHGYTAAADALKEVGISDSDYAEEYFKLIKTEDITSESFEKIRILTSSKVNELLKGYIESGKTAFVEKVLQKTTKESITSLMVWQTRTYQRWLDEGVSKKPFDYESIAENNIFLALQERYVELKKLQKQGKLLFDDVDDYIKMVAAFCRNADIDYTKKDQKFEGSEMVREIRYTLLELYKSAEALALEQATLMRGYKPAGDEYRFACPADRIPYLLKAKDRELRIKRIYGENEYERVVTERQVVEEIEKEREE